MYVNGAMIGMETIRGRTSRTRPVQLMDLIEYSVGVFGVAFQVGVPALTYSAGHLFEDGTAQVQMKSG